MVSITSFDNLRHPKGLEYGKRTKIDGNAGLVFGIDWPIQNQNDTLQSNPSLVLLDATPTAFRAFG